jgi:drug/metabolite transporter (DMT)-like permease
MVTRHEPTPPRKFLGVAVGLAGIMLIIGFDSLRGFDRDILAELAIVAATICYAGAAIFGRRFHGLDPIAPAAGSLTVGAVLLVPLSLFIDRPWTLHPSAASLAALVALAVFSTALAFVIYFFLLKSLGSVGTMSQAYLRVPVGVAIGVIFLGERLDATDFVGLLLAVAGVAAMTLPGRAAKGARGQLEPPAMLPAAMHRQKPG